MRLHDRRPHGRRVGRCSFTPGIGSRASSAAACAEGASSTRVANARMAQSGHRRGALFLAPRPARLYRCADSGFRACGLGFDAHARQCRRPRERPRRADPVPASPRPREVLEALTQTLFALVHRRDVRRRARGIWPACAGRAPDPLRHDGRRGRAARCDRERVRDRSATAAVAGQFATLRLQGVAARLPAIRNGSVSTAEHRSRLHLLAAHPSEDASLRSGASP